MKLHEILNEDLRWAYGKDFDKATPSNQSYQEEPDEKYKMVILWVDIRDFLSQMEEDYRINPDTGEGQIGGRVDRAKAHWGKEQWMDPSIAAWNPYTNAFAVEDGRHRLVAAAQMGEQYAPILFPASQLEEAKKRLSIKKIETI